MKKAFFTIISDEVRLYRILDVHLERTFLQRIFGVGTIIVQSSDKSLGIFQIKSVKKPKYVKELLSNNVEKQRDRKRVVNREIMGGADMELADDILPDLDDGDND